MGFTSFNENYYLKKINYFKSLATVEENDIYLAKQMIKMLDDFCDENYFDLYNIVERKYSGYTYLKEFVMKNEGNTFFKIPPKIKSVNEYKNDEIELDTYLKSIVQEAKQQKELFNIEKTKEIFINDIINYSNWLIKDNNDYAYLFLLRDTLLPYLYLSKVKNIPNLYPMLLSRKFLPFVSKTECLDDEIRGFIISALENNVKTFSELKDYLKPLFKAFFEREKELTNVLNELLANIKQEKIIVCESGVYGTFPILLAMLCDRVEIRLYTCCMYLQDVYDGYIYTNKYENNRDFETLDCQDRLFQLCNYKNKQFFVHEINDINIKKEAINEIKKVIG